MKRHRLTHSRERPNRTTPVTNSSAEQDHEVDQIDDPDDQDSGGGESILPDTAVSTPLNLNIRQSDSNDGLAYDRASLEREGNTLYVWIPAQHEGNLLSDE